MHSFVEAAPAEALQSLQKTFHDLKASGWYDVFNLENMGNGVERHARQVQTCVLRWLDWFLYHVSTTRVELSLGISLV